ncbi:MAG: polyphenol oxidase family protein [Myxococcota bacterium]
MTLVLRSRLLSGLPGLRHGFSTRTGGVSKSPYDTLNLAFHQDDSSCVEENRKRFARAARLEWPWHEVRQVHGVEVVSEEGAGLHVAADGVMVTRPRLCAVIKTADCVPLLVARVHSGSVVAVAAIHCGWRGTVDGIVPRALRNMAGPGTLYCALGPAISQRAFEVGPEVVERARQSLGGREPNVVIGPRGRPHLDLVALVKRHIVHAGVDPAHVDDLGLCTHSDPRRFFSYRRDGPSGHHAAVIGFEE